MKNKQFKKNKQGKKAAAMEKIKELFNQAELRFKEDPKISNRYVGMARKLQMKFKIKWPRGLKRRFCKHCYSYLKPGVNARIRLQQGKQGKVVYFCNSCKKYMRFPYKTRNR